MPLRIKFLFVQVSNLFHCKSPLNHNFLFINSGVFQLKQARSYAEEHCSTADLDGYIAFPLQICNSDRHLLRIRFKSRHSNCKTYYTYLHFNEKQIINSCCDCPSGDRKVGICSHRTSAIWFLGYQRHSHLSLNHQPSATYLALLDDSDLIEDFVETSDDDDDDLLYALA